MPFSEYTKLPVRELETLLKTSCTHGLSERIAQENLKKHGPNSVDFKEIKWWSILFRQFKSAFIYLLIAAAVVSFFLGEVIDAGLIVLFVVINVLLGFFQEFKSEQALKMLKKFIIKKSHVIRSGKDQIIKSENLTVGDLVIIETGDIVPADLRLVECEDLIIDESTLTGESKQVNKISDEIQTPVTEHYKALNMAFSGTTVVEGEAKGIVVSVGKGTEFGKIAKLTVETESPSAFEKEISKFSKFILILTFSTLLLVFFTHITFKKTISTGDLIIFSIALAVGVIPEAMPLVTTFSLSMGASKLAKKNVVLKRLSALQDMGEIEVLCTDKTGTLTENVLEVANIYSKSDKELYTLVLFGADYAGKEQTPNNSFDLAILGKVNEKQKNLVNNIHKIYGIPFNPTRRRNSVLVSVDGKQTMIVRGAVESIMPYVTGISTDESNEIIQWVLKEGREGKRIIAVAKKYFSGKKYEVKDEEENLSLVGMISFIDPIKPTTFGAVQKAKEYGVKLKILTGDSPEVAGAVAFQTGISQKIDDVVTGEDFFKLNPAEQEKTLENINVYARVSPEHKFKIIELLQKNSEVGYLGDGINDAPALKIAGVALVVDSAADISKEISDIVLLKKDLKVIIDGIEMGRKTYVNVTNYIKATLASNFGNFYAMAFATLIVDYLPMLPVQVLLLNLLSDFPMVSIATDNVDKLELKSPKKYNVRDIILFASVLGVVSTLYDFMMFAIFRGYGPAGLQTHWFIGSALTELVLIYSIRTKFAFFKSKILPSFQIIILTVAASIAAIGIPFTSFGEKVFGFIRPTGSSILLLLAIVVGYFISTELVKKIYFRYIHTA